MIIFLSKPHNQTPPTPWHQDVPYWPFRGKQIASIWLVLTPVTIEGSGLEFVRDLNNDNEFYLPEAFGASDKKCQHRLDGKKGEGIPCPDIEADAIVSTLLVMNFS